jgi:mannose-6-phosphate isomerase-like protein (cupin superfamily)
MGLASRPGVRYAQDASSAGADQRETLNVLGSEMLVKVDSASSNGVVAVVEVAAPPGKGPPRHLHSREDEEFYVIDGRVKIWRGDEVLDVGRDGVVFVPRGLPHTYQNVGASPGPGSFEGFFREVWARRLSVPEHLKEITEIAERYGLAIVGPPPDAR